MSLDLLSYDRVLQLTEGGRRHILLGNGFSIACDAVFSYPSLYDAAVQAGLSPRAQQVFKRVGTSNFEGVLRLLDNTHSVATTYGVPADLVEEIKRDSDVVKRTLIEAITSSHLAHTGEIEDARKDAAAEFFRPYHNVFTTNYDLLPYWVNMHRGSRRYQDGFRSDEDDPDAPFVVFSERLGDHEGLFYLHGALHFFIGDGQLCKHCWSRTGVPLIDLIRAGLDAEHYPLFIAEGAPEQKMEQIQRVGYLWYALDKFSRISGPLIVYGHSLGPSDQHIADAIADNGALEMLCVGIHGNPDSERNLAIRATVDRIAARRERWRSGRRPSKKTRSLVPVFFDSGTAKPWGLP